MTRRRALAAAGAASLVVGGLGLTAASVATAVGIDDHGIGGVTIVTAAVLITFGFAADGRTSVLNGTSGKVIHIGMTGGIASFFLFIVLGALGLTAVSAVGALGFVGLLGFAAAGVGLAVGALARAHRASDCVPLRNERGNRLRPLLQRARRVHEL